VIDEIITGLSNFILFGLVVGIRRVFNKEGISSFLIHIDKRGWYLFAEGVLIGALLFSLYPITAVLLGIGSIDIVTDNILNSILIISTAIVAALAVSLFEESLFRGYVFLKLLKKFPTSISIIIPSIIFGSLHFFAYSSTSYFWIGLINATIVASLLCIIVRRTNSLLLAVGYHMAWNLIQNIMLSKKNILIRLQIENGILTGNAYTPEAGLITTGILLIMFAYILLRFKIKESSTSTRSKDTTMGM